MSLARDGFLRLGPALAPGACAMLRDEIDDRLVRGAVPSPHGVIVHNAWRRVPALAAELATGALAGVARGVLGTDEIVLFQDHVIVKPAGTPAPVVWHQDYAYWPLDRPHGLTMWVALDDAGEDNGCLRYVPGSQAHGERCAAVWGPGAPAAGDDALPPLAPDGDGVAVPVAAGEVLVHDPLVWHMSPPNRSPRPRRAWSLSWIAPSARWAPERAPHPYTTMRAVDAGACVAGPEFLRFGQ